MAKYDCSKVELLLTLYLPAGCRGLAASRYKAEAMSLWGQPQRRPSMVLASPKSDSHLRMNKAKAVLLPMQANTQYNC
jgi:hypothetical protein